MNDFRYILEKGSKKFICPNCNRKSFVRYIDTETGEYLPERYGRCDHDNRCIPHYHLNPYKDGYAKMIWDREQKVTGVTKVSPKKQKYFHNQPKPIFFDFDIFKQTLQPERYEKNTFIQNLFFNVSYPFEITDVTKVTQLYRLGTVVKGYRAGAVTFPFIDIKGNIRAIQVKQFDKQNHTTGTDFLHSITEKHYTRNNKPLPEWLKAYNKNEKKVSCLFGEHLLSKYPNNPVALVEAPKTAVYGTLYFGLPETDTDLIWLAVYNKSSFSFDKLKILQGRFVYVFPDLSKDGNTFKEWETKAKEYESQLSGTHFIFSDLLERLAPERDKSKGYDIADYLIKQDWRLFRKLKKQPPLPEPEKVTKVSKVSDEKKLFFNQKVEVFKTERIRRTKKEQLQDWSNEIKELENYFANIEIPNQPIKLNEWSTIIDCSLFIKSHLAVIKKYNGNKIFLPHLDRLRKLENILSYAIK